LADLVSGRRAIEPAAADFVVAIPVCNEAERIGACLEALDRQSVLPNLAVLLLLNNCTDESARVVAQVAPGLRIRIHVAERNFPAPLAHAGQARRVAMDLAAEMTHPGGVLLSTDADGRVDRDWLLATLAAFSHGVDAVAGCTMIDPADETQFDRRLIADSAAEGRYAALLDRIAALLDPDPCDPWPRHDEHSGASIAVRVAAYRKTGGIPVLPVAEDRAFFAALRRVDARIRHAPDVTVTVSGRTDGRAAGGMADTIRRRMLAPDLYLDERLEPVADAARRARMRARARRLFANGRLGEAAQGWGVSAEIVERIEGAAYFGTAWATLEEAMPTLRPRRLLAADLPRATRGAEQILSDILLTGSGGLTPAASAGRSDTAVSAGPPARTDRPGLPR
jgi:GT2 family glycosyltransferase